MKYLKVLPEESSLFNMQKLCVSDDLFPKSSNGKFATITTSNNTFFLCQIFSSQLMHPSFCNIETSVCGHCQSVGKEVYPDKKTVDMVSVTNINILPAVDNIKSIVVSVVFSTPVVVNEWKDRKIHLEDTVKNILKMFVVQNNTFVSTDCMKSILDIKIEKILVECIGKVRVGRIINSTKIRIKKLMSRDTFEQIYTDNDNIPVLGGLDEPMKILKDLVMASQGGKIKQPAYKRVLILGPSGCGKTVMVHRAARDCGSVLKTLVGPEIGSPLPGEAEKALSNVFKECRLLAQECPGGCILLLDQVESLCERHDRSANSHLVRVTNQLFTLLESVDDISGLIVVGTSSKPQTMDQAVRRPGRFDQEIHIGVSSESERASILRALTSQSGLSGVVCDSVAQWTPGFVGADLALLTANVNRLLHKLGLPENHNIEAELLLHWRTCVGQLQPSALRGQVGVIHKGKGPITLLGGVDKVKQSLVQAIQWPLTHSEAFRRMGLPYPKGVLLYGPPGCAKTSLVRDIARTTDTTFLSVSAAEIYSPYVGDAEKTIAELFHRARLGSPAILFIDEIDALVGCRGNRERGTQERILTAFLTEMDGVGIQLDSGTSQAGVVVVAATNRPDVLDPALTRPGRFDRLVYVGPPGVEQRLDILRKITSKMPLAADVNLPVIAQNTDLFSGADLAQLCKEAGLKAMTLEGMAVTEVSQRHWEAALVDMKPSLTADQVEKYKQIATGTV